MMARVVDCQEYHYRGPLEVRFLVLLGGPFSSVSKPSVAGKYSLSAFFELYMFVYCIDNFRLLNIVVRKKTFVLQHIAKNVLLKTMRKLEE